MLLLLVRSIMCGALGGAAATLCFNRLGMFPGVDKWRRKYESTRSLFRVSRGVMEDVVAAYDDLDITAMDRAVARCKHALSNLPEDVLDEPNS